MMSEVNLSRRGFLKSFGALAAAAVVAPTMLVKLQPSDLERLFAMMKTGIVENQTFFFREPITIGFNNLIIRGCRFIFDCPHRMGAAITLNGSGLLMEYCDIDCGPVGADYGIEVLPQSEADMTSTIQSAISTLSRGTGTERALAFGAGTYLVNSPLLVYRK